MTNKEAAHTLLYSMCRSSGNMILIDDNRSDEFLDAICLAVSALMRHEEQHGKHEEKESIWHDAKTDKPTANGDYCIIREENPERIFTAHYNTQTGLWTGKGCMYDDVAQWTEYRELRK